MDMFDSYAYERGFEAALFKVPLESNPFKESGSSYDYDSWEDGWYNGTQYLEMKERNI